MANPNIKARLEKLERVTPDSDQLALLSIAELEALVAAYQVIIDEAKCGRMAEWPEIADVLALHNVSYSQMQFEGVCRRLWANSQGLQS